MPHHSDLLQLLGHLPNVVFEQADAHGLASNEGKPLRLRGSLGALPSELAGPAARHANHGNHGNHGNGAKAQGFTRLLCAS